MPRDDFIMSQFDSNSVSRTGFYPLKSHSGIGRLKVVSQYLIQPLAVQLMCIGGPDADGPVQSLLDHQAG